MTPFEAHTTAEQAFVLLEVGEASAAVDLLGLSAEVLGTVALLACCRAR